MFYNDKQRLLCLGQKGYGILYLSPIAFLSVFFLILDVLVWNPPDRLVLEVLGLDSFSVLLPPQLGVHLPEPLSAARPPNP